MPIAIMYSSSIAIESYNLQPVRESHFITVDASFRFIQINTIILSFEMLSLDGMILD